MSKASPNFLVVEPALTYLKTASRLTPAQYAQFMQDFEGYTQDVVIVPYTQAMQRQVRAKYKQELASYSKPRRRYPYC